MHAVGLEVLEADPEPLGLLVPLILQDVQERLSGLDHDKVGKPQSRCRVNGLLLVPLAVFDDLPVLQADHAEVQVLRADEVDDLVLRASLADVLVEAEEDLVGFGLWERLPGL